MKSGYKIIIWFFSALILTACGGGGDLKKEGDTPITPPPPIVDTYDLKLILVNSDGVIISEVSRDTPGTLTATLLKNNAVLADKRITFSLEGDGALSPDSALTDVNGVATINILTGNDKGTGEVVASFESDDSKTTDSPSISFEVAGDATPPHPIEQYSIQLNVEDSGGETLRVISHNSPGTVIATLIKNGSAVSNEVIRFSVEGQGTVNPSSGGALTNNEGQAQVTLLTGTEADAGVATASFSLDGESVDDTFNYSVIGDAPGGSTTENQLNIQLLNNVTGIQTSRVSALEPGLVSILLSDQDNEPLTGQVVTFTSSLGSFLPNRGTALTDNIGRATIIITAGSVEGAGEINVAFGNSQAILGFVTAGDEIDPVEARPEISFNIYDCSNSPTWSREQRNFEVCAVTDNITNDSAGVIGITVTRSGTTQTLSQVLVSATTTLGAVSPDSGTAITNINGKAVLDLYANSQVGAGELTLNVKDVSSVKAFEIGRVNISLVLNTALGNNSLAAGGSTVLDVTVINPDGSLATGQPFSLIFNSECKTAGKALIDSPVVTTAGRGYATYRSIGCEGEDTITVSAATGGDTATDETTVNVDSVSVGSIQYISAAPKLLALKGSGGITGAGARMENSVVKFKLLDETGLPASNELVCFELSTEAGGLSLAPQPIADEFNACSNLPTPPSDLSTPNKYAANYTDNLGEVSVTVSSGSVPTSVKVYAQWQGSNGQGHERVISNISDELRVTTGLTDNRNFSMAASLLNPEAWSIDGETVTITIRASDRFNNLVSSGAAVTFLSESGDIDASCLTGEKSDGNPNGTCLATWTSAGTRPFENIPVVCPNGGFTDTSVTPNRQILSPPCIGNSESGYFDGSNSIIAEPRPGRATITAYTIGEENFIDLNGNGLFDLNETFSDEGEAFTDDNEDNVYRGLPEPLGAEREEFFDYNNNNQFDVGDGKYTGLLCSENAASICSDTGTNLSNAQINVYRNLAIVMSGSAPMVKLVEASGDRMDTAQDIDLTVFNSKTIYVYVSDENNNTLPFGTTIKATTANGIIEGVSSYEIGNNNVNHPLRFSFTVGRESSGNQKTSGLFQVTVKTPRGTPTTYSLTVLDAG